MPQAAKIIDISRSFVPIDPRVFPETLHATGKEDYPEERVPVVGYKGYNFLPTAQGYKSYFGTNANLNLDALTSRVDEIFIVQTKTYENHLIALCEDGIWKKSTESTGAWSHLVTLIVPDEGEHKEWTYCMIGEDVFCYRATEAQYYKLSPNVTNWEVDAFVADVSSINHIATAVTGAIPAGTYIYYIAHKNAQGAISAPSAGYSVILSVASSVVLSWASTGTNYGHRIYRYDGAVYKYQDIAASSGSSHTFSDINTLWSDFVGFPDTTWSAERYYAFDAVPITPNFLNMEGQHGIFAAGIRLGFWDSENSIAWSSIDDFADFTPSVETLAGSAIFSDVNGRIVNILSQLDGFVIYATRSIVAISRKVDATFQWDPLVLLNDSGIAFLKQVCTSAPDNIHFAWTSTGFAKIEGLKLTFIIPEVYDYLASAKEPYFLKLIEGRYLFIQCLDPDYIDGQITAKVATVPTIEYNFDSTDVPDVVDNQFVLEGSDACYSFDLMNNAHLQTGINIINSGGGPGNYPDGPAKNWLRSYYTAYFSRTNTVEDPVFGPTPCPTVGPDGVEYNFCPVGDAGQLSRLTQDATNKWIVEEVPGDPLTRFDTEQFMAWQMAIWRTEDEARQKFIQKVLNRSAEAYGVPSVTSNAVKLFLGETLEEVQCDASYGKTINECDVGDFIVDMSAPFWGMNACSFWLTRYCTQKMRVQRRKVNTTVCEFVSTDPVWIDYDNTGTEVRADPLQLAQYRLDYGAFGGNSNAEISHTSIAYPESPYAEEKVVGWIKAKPGGYLSPNPTAAVFPEHIIPYTKTTKPQMLAYNHGSSSAPGIYAVETAFLQLKGWWYTDKNGAIKTIAASPTCARPDMSTPQKSNAGGSSGAPGAKYGGLPIGEDGTLCGIPFDPIQFENLTGETIEWETPALEVPEGDFLLQKGSIGPIYPDFVGAYIYDLQLKKWGKYKDTYKALLNYSPINTVSSGIIPFSVFGIKGGCIKADGYVYLFDEQPASSYITYGKIGYYRQGFTYLEEIKVNFASHCQAQIYAEGSLDSKNLEASIIKSQTIDNENTGVLYSDLSARWFDITISGIFNLTHLEFRGVFAGRR